MLVITRGGGGRSLGARGGGHEQKPDDKLNLNQPVEFFYCCFLSIRKAKPTSMSVPKRAQCFTQSKLYDPRTAVCSSEEEEEEAREDKNVAFS